jgi:thiol-disulfide isomerase/thioredoxin
MLGIVLALWVQAPGPRFEVALAPRAPTKAESLRWSPKGAKVELAAKDGALSGAFELGPRGLAPVGVRLEKLSGAAHIDVLWLDANRDGRFDAAERLATTPSETRGKWWSSFEAELPVPIHGPGIEAPASRAYPLSLWFVEDPQEPDAAPVLRWSRRGWHEGECTVGGKPAFVLVTELELDGVFDQRDSWALARERDKLLGASSRALDGHAWLDGKAYRPTAIDPHGRTLAFEPFDPGLTEAEEAAKQDRYAPDRAAPRAATPLAFGRDLAAALARAKQERKRVLVDFETAWCGPCKTMDQLVYSAAAVVDGAKDTFAVKVDGDEQRELVKKYGVSAYPTLILLDAQGRELRRAVGYRSVAEMVEMLKP